MEGELSMARAIQSDLLPSRPPFIRGLNVLQLHAGQGAGRGLL